MRRAVPATGLAVYPRVCGGTWRSYSRFAVAGGLSPRVRGNRFAAGVGERGDRSIPACAGEPDDVEQRGNDQEVYPRVCGGTAYAAGFVAAPKGLSPRVRGNPPLARHLARFVGSIPACAGEPLSVSQRVSAPTVYPRVCGGTDGDTANAKMLDGLSPRVRGNRLA